MMMPTDAELLGTLAPTHRLALAYAPAQCRRAWLGFLALDARLASVVRAAREPVLGQLRLAWWRERLTETSPARGEPLLYMLESWGPQRQALVTLVDGWEGMLGEAPLGARALAAFAEGRAVSAAALAHVCNLADHAGAAERMARKWGLGDLTRHLTHPDERAAALALLAAQDWIPARLPRALRPLVVLHALARRQRRGPQPEGLAAFLSVMRLGILGR